MAGSLPADYAALIGTLIDGWKLEQCIGYGASAGVFRAVRGSTQSAVKVYNARFSSGEQRAVELERIQRQVEIGETPCKYLIPILGGGECGITGHLFLVMAYMNGRTLAEVREDVPNDRIPSLIAQIASAARWLLEERQIVHRDIKPTNILVSDDYRRAVLLDLGVLRPLVGSDLTDNDACRPFLGTTRYSPWEYLARSLDDSDIEAWRAVTFYQLGAVLHDLISVKPMFADVPDEPYANLISAVRRGHPKLKANDMREGANADLAGLSNACLARDPKARLEKVRWDDFEHRIGRKRPTLVMLYCGGTIGSASDETLGHERKLRRAAPSDATLSEKFKARLLRDYEQVSPLGKPLEMDILWESMPIEHQILSEQADHTTWNAIVKALANVVGGFERGEEAGPVAAIGPVEDRKGTATTRRKSAATKKSSFAGEGNAGNTTSDERYLAGIIVLHGTDTLAYSAVATALAMRHLPCPIVFTGSNDPPHEDTLLESDILTSRSDAWTNLIIAVHFIQSFGHRLTEVFVAFGSTIHFAFNLRKLPTPDDPGLRRMRGQFDEAFAYRNLSTERQYAFRLIDGLFCNNLYPIEGEYTYQTLSTVTHPDYRHTRRMRQGNASRLETIPFQDNVLYVSVVPGRTQSSIPKAKGGRKGALGDVRAVLLEGYESGTFPSRAGAPLTRLLELSVMESVPVVLISRSGLIPSSDVYEIDAVGGRRFPIVRLYRTIGETALPLVSLAAGRISTSDWESMPKDGDQLLARKRLLEGAFLDLFSESEDLLSLILGNALDLKAQQQRSESRKHRLLESYGARKERLFAEARDRLSSYPIVPAIEAVVRLRGGRAKATTEAQMTARGPDVTVLLRQHFLWNLIEIGYPYERAGCGPDAFVVLNSAGFTWGRKTVELLKGKYEKFAKHDRDLLGKHSADEQKRAINHACQLIRSVVKGIAFHGIANVAIENLAIVPGVHLAHRGTGVRAYDMVSDFVIRKHGRLTNSSELYAVQGLSEGEVRFFKNIDAGVPLDSSLEEFREALALEYRGLHEETWSCSASALDWFVIGATKGALCEALKYLSCDPWVVRCDRNEPDAVDGLRQSILTHAKYGDRDQLRFRHAYYGREQLWRTAADGGAKASL